MARWQPMVIPGLVDEMASRLSRFFSGPVPLMMGHRGARGIHDENTLEAIECAVGMGLPAVEIDVQATRDGHAVLMHDRGVERTTDGRGPVVGKDLREVRSLKTRAGHRVPALSDVFERFATSDLRFFIDLKRAIGLEEHVLALVRRHDLLERVLLDTESTGVAQRLRREDPDVEIALSPFVPFGRDRWIRTAVAVGATHIDAYHRFLTAGFVARARDQGLTVSAWVVNRRSTVARLTRDGVHGIMGDHPNVYVDPTATDRPDWPL